jgi:phosphopantothenoylcysteine decarboxylase/phosphopantothenate--cysteine ligase
MTAPASKISREIILGVGGGISAYKACDLLRRLQDAGFLVSVIPTRASLNFVGKATWEALSGRPVQDDLWNNVHEVPHIALAKKADAIVIAPATADLIARIASGRADDFLTNVILASTAPLIVVPAMHTEMWLNASTVANVATLRDRGITVLDPSVGKLTSGDVGIGRFPESAQIVREVEEKLHHKSDLRNRKVLISAGGTREAIDPVRYIGNLSSGKQGIALAINAASRGASVSLVIANSQDTEIEGVEVVHVTTAQQMNLEMQNRFTGTDIVVMSAAVSDARPASPSSTKYAKGELTSISLVENPDIIGTLALKKVKEFVIGFAAQTGSDSIIRAQEKLRAKNLDLIYVNDVSGGDIFGKDDTEGTILDVEGKKTEFSRNSKMTLASQLFSIAIDKLGYANDNTN